MRRRLFGAAAGLAVAAGILTVPATPAVAAATHVGIVVRYGGSSQTACTSVGGTGLSVLSRKFSVVVGQAAPYVGFILKINGTGALRPDTTHYWSYWHSSGNGSWTYSSAGAGSYTPKAGTVEGWSYVNGTSSAPSPPSVTYSALCGKLDPKPIHPKPKPTHSKQAATHPRSVPTNRHAAATERTATPATGTAQESRRAQTPTSPKQHAVQPATSATVTPAVAGRRTPTLSSTPTSPVLTGNSSTAAAGTIRAAGPPPRHSAAGFPAWGTTLALLIVVVLGGVAWLRIRRRPE